MEQSAGRIALAQYPPPKNQQLSRVAQALIDALTAWGLPPFRQCRCGGALGETPSVMRGGSLSNWRWPRNTIRRTGASSVISRRPLARPIRPAIWGTRRSGRTTLAPGRRDHTCDGRSYVPSLIRRIDDLPEKFVTSADRYLFRRRLPRTRARSTRANLARSRRLVGLFSA